MVRPGRVVTRTVVVSLGAAVVGAALVTNTLSSPKARAANAVTHAVPSHPMVATPTSWTSREVREGSVSKLVSSKGALAATTTTNLEFAASHRLSKLLVKVGDRVKKNQLLAVEGYLGAENTLMQLLQVTAGQRANLALIVNDVTVPGDLKILQQARRVAADARHNIELGVKADQDALDRARDVLKMDQQVLDAALKKAAADGCGPNGPLALMPTAVETTLCASDDAAIKTAQTTVFNQTTTVIADQDKLNSDRGTLQTTYATDLVTVRVDENAYNIARTNRPSLIALQQAVLLADQSAVLGNEAFDNCFVYAPADGVVTAVTGVPGEWMQGQGAQSPPSPLAPGSLAQIPDVGGAATSDIKNPGTLQGVGGLEALRSTAPAGGAFIQLSNLDAYQVVVPFSETDAVHIQPGSSARLTFDALPGVEHTGQVTAVSPIGVNINGVTNYYATVLVTDADEALKSGLTTTVSIVTNTIKNKALVVPTPAVSTHDGKSFVETPSPDGKPQRVQFTPGKVGDDNTEIISGLTKGQKVIVPSGGPLPQPQSQTVAPRPEAVRPR
jgi:HlyD family secretion protein